MITACLCTFNDAATITFTLASLIGHVDQILAIDGPWQNYSNYCCSQDDTIDLLERHGAKVITGRWKTQVDKRNEYIKRVNTNDWIIVIDGDERLWHGWFLNQVEQYDYPFYTVPILSINYPANLYWGANKAGLLEYTPKQNRLFKKYHGTHYWKKHYYVFHDGYNNTWLHYAPECPLAIIHLDFLRPHTRKQEKMKYYTKREHIVEEGRGHYSFWLYPNCWKECYIFNAKGVNFNCSSDKDSICGAFPGRKDTTRGRKQIGPLFLIKY